MLFTVAELEMNIDISPWTQLIALSDISFPLWEKKILLVVEEMQEEGQN